MALLYCYKVIIKYFKLPQMIISQTLFANMSLVEAWIQPEVWEVRGEVHEKMDVED